MIEMQRLEICLLSDGAMRKKAENKSVQELKSPSIFIDQSDKR